MVTKIIRAAEQSRSVSRAIEILDMLLQHDEPMAVGEIAKTLAIPRSSAYGIVNVLSGARYLEPTGDSKLFLGPKLFELGMAYGNKLDLIKVCTPIVKELRDATKETVQLSVLRFQYAACFDEGRGQSSGATHQSCGLSSTRKLGGRWTPDCF